MRTGSGDARKRKKAMTLEEKYNEIANWEVPDICEQDDLSQRNFELRDQHEPLETFVTYGVPPGL